MKKIFERRWQIERPGTQGNKLYISAEVVQTIGEDALEGHLLKDYQFDLTDGENYVPQIRDVQEFLQQDMVDRMLYAAEGFDCDDFAIVLWGHAKEQCYKDGLKRAAWPFGVVEGYLPHPHKINWVITQDPLLGGLPPTPAKLSGGPYFYFIEPQTDEIYVPGPTDYVWKIEA